MTDLNNRHQGEGTDAPVLFRTVVTASGHRFGHATLNAPASLNALTLTMVDLLQANRAQLESAGVLPERIHIAPICTMCRTDLFFSYRKEKSLHGKVGRLMAVVGRK